jgi:8-oxo-dGTP diphosphatase
MTRTAVFVLLERDNQYFFLRRFNTGWADGLLTLPAGHVDKGDSVIKSAIKETKEEAGVDVSPEDLEFIHVDYILDEYVNFYFRANKFTGEPFLCEPHAASEAIWINKNMLPEDIVPQVKNLLIQLQTKNYFSERNQNL